jgi:hypothetical protein
MRDRPAARRIRPTRAIGTIAEVEVNIGDDVYLDIERDFAAAMARD